MAKSIRTILKKQGLYDKRAVFEWNGSNLLNHYYYSILGGPQIGGFYHVNFLYGIK